MKIDNGLLSKRDIDIVFSFLGHCTCGQDVTMSDLRLELVTVCGRCGRVFAYCVEMGLQDHNVDFQEVYNEMTNDPESYFYKMHN